MTRVSLAARIVERERIRVISAYNLLTGAPVGAIVAEMYDVPLTVTNLGEIFSHRAGNRAPASHDRADYRVASVLTSLTRHCANSYREVGITRDVQRVLHYGIDVGRFRAGIGHAIRDRFSIARDDDVVLDLGPLVRDMGLTCSSTRFRRCCRVGPTRTS